MASSQGTVDFIIDQLAEAGEVAGKKMFGEYGIFCDGKMVALLCDDQLFVKPTAGGRAYASEAAEGIPYPGAKPCLRIDGERWDDGAWLCGLIRITARELPMPKKKAKSP